MSESGPIARIELRPIGPADEELVLHIYASTREEELAGVDWSAEQREAFLRMQFNAQHTYYQEHYPDTSFDVVLVDGVPAGRLYVARWAEELRVVDVALLPPYRGAGVGRRLMEAVLAEAEAAGKPVRIHVEVYNPARHLYERLGFRPVEDRGVYLMMERAPGLR